EGELPDIDTNDTSDTPEAETNVTAEVTPPVVAKPVVKKKPVAIKTIEPTPAAADDVTPVSVDHYSEPDFVSGPDDVSPEPVKPVVKKARKAPVKK
ncbi:hypothetical protein, partial [Luteibacter rhizovicinus]